MLSAPRWVWGLAARRFRGGDRTSLSAFQSLEVPGLVVATLPEGGGQESAVKSPAHREAPPPHPRSWPFRSDCSHRNPGQIFRKAGRDPAPPIRRMQKALPLPFSAPPLSNLVPVSLWSMRPQD